ncbi:DUF2057 family protein [Vibrio sp. 03_296]|uniref:DUF2057 family protein n=1 Tax=Vibrio sp. 03_296 TaxID=2024409 RepID=UPI002D8049AE|nr:DUF2057 family protein [Vibrio sp. 03_296]
MNFQLHYIQVVAMARELGNLKQKQPLVVWNNKYEYHQTVNMPFSNEYQRHGNCRCYPTCHRMTSLCLSPTGRKPSSLAAYLPLQKPLNCQMDENQIIFQYEPYFSQGNDRIGVESNVIIAKFSATDTDLNIRTAKVSRSPCSRAGNQTNAVAVG